MMDSSTYLVQTPQTPFSDSDSSSSSVDGTTTENELRGWYIYDFANSPYYQVYTVGIFPIFVKWLAEGVAGKAAGLTPAEIYACNATSLPEKPADMMMPGLGIVAASVPQAIMWVKTAFQIIALLSFSALGDYGNHKNRLLKILTWMGSVLIFLNIFCVHSSMYWFAGILHILAGCCFVLCVSYYNAYLPLLVSNYDNRSEKTLSDLTDDASNKGMMAGCLGGVSALVLSWAILTFLECDPCKQVCSEFDLFFWPALSIAMVGIWWFAFSIYTFIELKKRSGPELPEGENIYCIGWKDAYTAFRAVLQYKQTLLFCVAYFVASDALATLTNNAFLIKEEMNRNSPEGEWTTMVSLHMLFILGIAGAMVGIFLYMMLQRLLGVSGKTMLLVQFAIMAVVAIICLAGGLDSIGYMPVMAPVSLTVGSMQGYFRSIFCVLIPPGKESAMFAFYEITDKGSALVGTLVTLIIVNVFKSYLPSMAYVLLGFITSLALLFFVDVEQGMRDLGKGEAAAE